MGSHSVNCHPAVVRIPPLPPAEAGTRFGDPRGMQGLVDLCYVKVDRPGIEPATCKSQVQRPTAKPPRTQRFSSSTVGGRKPRGTTSALAVMHVTDLFLCRWDPVVRTTMTPLRSHLATSYTRRDIQAPSGASATCRSDSE